jgi:hypothetical protein
MMTTQVEQFIEFVEALHSIGADMISDDKC